MIGGNDDEFVRRCCWASCRARRIFLSSTSSSSSSELDDEDDDDDDDSLLLLLLLLLLIGRNKEADCVGIFNSWFRGVDDELAAVNEIFELEFSLHMFDDGDDKKDGRCLCFIKYCAKRQSFSAKKKMLTFFCV